MFNCHSRQTQRRTLPLLVWIFCISGLQVVESSELPSLDTVSKTIADHNSQLKSLYLDIVVRTEAQADPDVVQKWLNKAALRNYTVSGAFKGDKRYKRELWQETVLSHGRIPRPEVDPNASPAQRARQERLQKQYDNAMKAVAAAPARKPHAAQEPRKTRDVTSTVAFDGTALRRQSRLTGFVYSSKDLPQHQFDLQYLVTIGMYLPDVTSPAAYNQAMRRFLLPGTLENSSYRVAADSVDGSKCLRLDGMTRIAMPGVEQKEYADTLWLDIEHGFVLRKRQLAFPKGHLTLRMVNSAPREVLPGVWLPMECEVQEFAPHNAPDSLRQVPLAITRLKVAKCGVNDVADSLFTLTFPPGTTVTDFALADDKGLMKTGVQYTVPADPSMLDDAIRYAVERAADQPSGGWSWLLVISVILPVAATVILFWRRRSRARGG